MTKELYCLAFFLFLTFFSGFAQSPIPILSDDGGATPFVNAKGKVLFTLPKGHIPITKYPSSDFFIEKNPTENQPLNVFKNGICVVQTYQQTYYWINESGAKIKEFGKQYASMSAFINGYCMAWEKSPKGNGYLLLYLNQKGENAFGDKKFWEASPFSEGLAAVQMQEGEPWGYIDETGNTVLSVKEIDPKMVKRFYNFSSGLAKVDLRDSRTEYGFSSVFINRQGKVVLSPYEVFQNRTINRMEHFSQNRLLISFRRPKDIFYDVVCIDTLGKVLFSYENVEIYSPYFVDDLGYVAIATPKSKKAYHRDFYFIDSKGKKTTITLPPTQSIHNVQSLNANFLVLTIDKGRRYWNALHQTKDFKQLHITENFIIGYNNTYVLTKNQNTYQLIKHDGTLIWQTPIGKQIFTNLSAALRVRKKVRNYVVKDTMDFKLGLFQLKKLENLTIEWVKSEKLPNEIGKLKKLKTLKIQYLSNLKTFPKHLVKLKKLETLEINDCKNYEGGLEYIIENMPSLRKVTLVNIKLEKYFEEKMKKINPNLEINTSFQYDEIIEEGVIK